MKMKGTAAVSGMNMPIYGTTSMSAVEQVI